MDNEFFEQMFLEAQKEYIPDGYEFHHIALEKGYQPVNCYCCFGRHGFKRDNSDFLVLTFPSMRGRRLSRRFHDIVYYKLNKRIVFKCPNCYKQNNGAINHVKGDILECEFCKSLVHSKLIEEVR